MASDVGGDAIGYPTVKADGRYPHPVASDLLHRIVLKRRRVRPLRNMQTVPARGLHDAEHDTRPDAIVVEGLSPPDSMRVLVSLGVMPAVRVGRRERKA